ncbi:MAG: ATP-binding protein [Verrucomicrobiota bacterium]
MFSKSIRWRIQAWHGLLLVCLVTALTIGFYIFESRARFREIDSQLHAFAPPLLPKLAPLGRRGSQRPGEEFRGRPEDREQGGPPPNDFGPPGFGEPPPRERPQANDDLIFARIESAGFYYVWWSPEREIIARSTNAPAQIPFPIDGEFNRRNSPLRTRGEFRELIHQTPGGHTVLIGASTAKIKTELRRIGFELTGAGVFVVVIGLAGGWWLAGRAIRPIAEISSAAGKISGGDLSRRINVSEAESELGQLAGVLNQTFERLEKSFEQQVRFTADASHELRTPISVILTQIQLALSRERSGEDYRQTLETCERAAERMRVLVNSLLELARVDSGDFELMREECDLGRIAREAMEFVEPLAKQKNVTLNHSIESVKINADALKLGQVFINLLTNAIQHNKDGVEVCLSVKQNGSRAIVRVADNGIGIPAEALPQLFARFYRVDQSRSRTKGNSGLGLAICKVIVEAHGGTIVAKSENSSGAEFIFELPLSTNDTT